MPFLSSFFFFAYILISKQSRKVNVNTVQYYHVLRISFVINAISLFLPLSSSPPTPAFLFFFVVVFFRHLKSLDKRCEVMDITITYGCTKTYFYMSEI